MDEPLNECELDLATIAQMSRHGSPFFSRLALALGLADYEQMQAVAKAFPGVWATYREMAQRAEDAANAKLQAEGRML